MTDQDATVDQHAVREIAMLLLAGPPDPDATRPAVWCARAGVSVSTFHAWCADPAFVAWFFSEVDPIAPVARRARGVRFWSAVDRALDAPTPNAATLRLYAEIVGLVGRGTVGLPEDAGMQDDDQAWALIESLPADLLREMATNADAAERERVEE